MMKTLGFSMLGLLISVAQAAGGELAAFPGAEGWGTTTPGGRGGKVVWVTNLNDNGPGSLREALDAPGPRTIVFRVAGVIHLKRPLVLGDLDDPKRAERRSFVSVAGHSAPGGGITVADRALMIGGGVHDVVIRHVRFRNSSVDGIGFLRGARRVVLDHCSVSWGTDENIGFLGDNQEVTIENCINAECLHYGDHREGPHSKGFLISRGANRVSVHHCFITGNVDRNPQFVGNNEPARHHFGDRFPVFDMRNNLIYNCNAQTRLKLGARANIVANHYVYGPRNSSHNPVHFTSDEEGSQAYLFGNISSKHRTNDQWGLVGASTGEGRKSGKDVPDRLKAPEPLAAPKVTTTAADEVVECVLPVAGALPHDETDRRLVREFLTGTGKCGAPDRTHDSPTPAPEAGEPNPDADRDGMPDAWEEANGLSPNDPTDSSLDRDDDGYTNLEEYLNHVAAELEREARQRFRGRSWRRPPVER